MADLSPPSKYSIHPVALPGEPCVEVEHKDSCDINLMLKNAARGRQIRTSRPGEYGYDDMNVDAISLRIQKAGLEEAILSGQKEFTQAELDLFPKSIREKFGFKLKASTPEPVNDDLNDNHGEEKKPVKKPKTKTPKNAPPPEPHDDDSSES